MSSLIVRGSAISHARASVRRFCGGPTVPRQVKRGPTPDYVYRTVENRKSAAGGNPRTAAGTAEWGREKSQQEKKNRLR